MTKHRSQTDLLEGFILDTSHLDDAYVEGVRIKDEIPPTLRSGEIPAADIPGYTFSRSSEVLCSSCIHLHQNLDLGYSIPLFPDRAEALGRIEQPCSHCGKLVQGVRSGHDLVVSHD